MNSLNGAEGRALAHADAVVCVIDGMLDAVWLVDPASQQVVAANAAAGELMGMEAASMIGRRVVELCAAPQDLIFWVEAAAGDSHGIDSESWVQRSDGRMIPVSRRVRRLRAAGHGELFMVVMHDLEEQKRVEAALEARVDELASTLESTAEGLLITDLSGRVRSFNHAFAAAWRMPDGMLRVRDDAAVLDFMCRAVADSAGYMRRLAALEGLELNEAVDTLTLRGGRVLQRVMRPLRSRGRVTGRLYSFRDITERIMALHRIDTLSHCDVLTGLPNRRVLADRVAFALALAQRDGTSFAVLLANLDRFKHINETLGQEIGDRVLIDVSDRLKACVRQVDTVARLGGDEFAVLVHQADAAGAEAAASRVLCAMQQPLHRGTLSFTVTCSIGIAMYPNHGASLDELVRHADAAMREVKDAGRAAYRFHADSMHARMPRLRDTLRLDTAMRRALDDGHFRVHYQPQVDIASGEVIGAEALLRWHDPQLGHVSPADFIPLAEESGLIIPIGEWVLCQATQQAAKWHAQGRRLVVSVNVSALQFQRDGFVERVAEALSAARLPPEWLELELTESILIQDAQQALLRLEALSALGVKLAIDDFGTGYSSLGYLKRFPIDRLKIDRSFVQGLPHDESDAGIVNAIVHLGRALQLEIVAEGVETEAQRQFLQTSGCEHYQGFLFAPALDSASFEARLSGIPHMADQPD